HRPPSLGVRASRLRRRSEGVERGQARAHPDGVGAEAELVRGETMAILQVSRKVDYALRAVIHLANEEANDRACSVAEIAARERIPRQFLEKIVQHLIHTGLVRSRRGPRGGYVLGRPAQQMTFRDV